MKDFNTDESLVGDSGNDNPKTKKVKATPITTAPPTEGFQPRQTGVKDDSFNLETPKNEFKSEELGITTDDYDNYGNIYKGQDINKMRAEYQSNWDRLGNLGMRVASNVIGGTISSLGSVPAIAEGIVDEAKGKDADFTNSIMQLGDDIKNWAKQNYPNYRENPNESWDIGDPAFWFEGAETAFSTLEYLAGSYGAVKGLGAVSKLLKAEQALAKVGLNAKAIGFGAKVVTGAGFSRNAENMMESMQLVKDTKDQLLNEWKEDPSKFEELKDSEVAKEINGEVTPESLAKHIAGKAGWEAYKTNSINIVFDALQFAPLVKGFNPSTRLGSMATSSAIKAENKALSGAISAASPSAKVFDYLNPLISGIGRSASEGAEEAINYVGTLRGKNLVNRLTGKPEEKTDVGDLTESAFWGMFGGMAYEGASKLANRSQSNVETEARIGEIKNRMDILSNASKAIERITSDTNLPDEIKKDHINAVKAELSLDLGLRAAQAGNVDLLLQQVESKEFANKLVDMGLTEPGEAEKAVAKTKSDILLAEQLYKDYYNTFQFIDGTQRAKNELISKSIVTDFFVRKNIEKRNNLVQELEHLMSNDIYVSSNSSTNIKSLVELEGLFAARSELNKVIRRTSKEDQLLSHRGQQEIENLNKRILEIKDQVKDERLNKEEINPRIIAKQAEIILMDAQNRLQKQFIKENTKPEAAKKQEEVIKDREKKANSKVEEDVLAQVKDVVESDNSIDTKKLTTYLEDYKNYPSVQKYLNDKINLLKSSEEKKQKQDNVKKEQEPITTPTDNPVNKAPNVSSTDFGGLGDYVVEDYDEKQIDPLYKIDIDNAIANKDYSALEGYLGDYMLQGKSKDLYLHTVRYARAKFAEHKKAINAAKESKELNTEDVQVEAAGTEFDEFSQTDTQKSGPTAEEKLNIKSEVEEEGDEPEVFEFLSKDISTETCTATIPMFRRFGYNGEGHQEYYQIKNGNILIQDKYVDLVKTLMNPEFTEGSEVEIIYDEAETKEEHKNDIYNAAFKVTYKGVTVAYIGRVENIDEAIKKLIEKGNRKKANEIALDLINIKRLRRKLSLDSKPFKTKIALKGNGTIISKGTNSTALRSIKGISEKLYALNTSSYRDRTTLVNLEDESERISNENPLTPGRVYMGLPDANGKIIPVPLVVSRINKVQAKEISANTKALLDVLNRGKNIENQEVRDLRDQIAKYIKVDKATEFDKPIGYRVYPQSVKEDGTTRDARIVVAYKNLKGEHKTAVIKKSTHTGELWLGIYQDEQKTYETTSADENFDKALNDLFTLKYHNVDFTKLNSKKATAFEYNEKVYKNYKEYLIDEEIIKTDVAQVIDKKGNVVSNLFGFNSDFKLVVETESIEEKKNEEKTSNKIQEVVSEKTPEGLADLFQLSGFESETTKGNAVTNDLGFRGNYEVYKYGATSVKTLLKEILARPSNQNVERVAKWLSDNSNKYDVDIIIGDLKGQKATAIYRPDKNFIAFDESKKISESYFQQVALHEIIHAVTVPAMSRAFEKPNHVAVLSLSNPDITDIPIKKNAPEATKRFIEEITSIRNEVTDQLTKKYGKSLEELSKDVVRFYGLESPIEFISEVMVNPNLRNEIRSLEGKQNLLTRIWNSIVDFLNDLFGKSVDRGTEGEELLKRAINLITDFVTSTSKENMAPYDTDITLRSKMIDSFDGNFNRTEIVEIVKTLEGFIANAVRRGKIDTASGLEDRDNQITIRENIRKAWRAYYDTTSESVKPKIGLIVNDYFDTFYDKAISNVRKNFKVGTAYDIDMLKENEGITKDWDDTKAQEVSSQDTVTKQIKLFVMTIPELDNLDHKFDEKENPLWNRKKSTTTGVANYVDFNVVYPYMIRNLIGARSRAEIISRLENMGKINPSFAYMAYELKKDENLIAQFESNLARKTVYDSYVTFISDADENREIWITDELKTSRYDYMIADDWVEAINKTIDLMANAEAKVQFKLAMDKLHLQISQQAKDFEKNKDSIVEQIYVFSGHLGLNLSMPAIKAVVENARTWQDVKSELFDTLDLISGSIELGRKNDDFARLNSIAKLEATYRFDVVENSGLDIQGNLIYAIRNPSYLSNWFNDLKSTTPEGRENLERVLQGMTKVPELQFSSWLWNTKSSPGLVNFDIVNGNRIPKITSEGTISINYDFIKKFNYHDFGGAKEVLSKATQKYPEFADHDWRLMNLISYLNLNDKNAREKNKEKDFALIPSIIASDSGKAGLIEVPKIKLKKTDIYRSEGTLKIKQDSEIFKAILNVAKGEVRRIQQVTNQLFEIVDNKLTVRKGLKLDQLQQYYHYGKSIVRNEDGIIDIEKTLIDDSGKPTGKALYFNNMSIREGEKITTLNEITGISNNGYLVSGEVDATIRGKIIKFVETFINQKVQEGIKDYSSLEDEIIGKHNNVADGSYSGLIAELVLNHYINNHEQFLFFNGTIAEYKDKIDTNKRAKQLFTPGIALSLEAMKINYQNGSQGDGQTFKAITIKDIKTTSHTIDFIAEAVKNNLTKERNYTKTDIKDFSIDKAKSKSAEKSNNPLVRDTYKIIKGYLAINAGDAQGYITLDRYEALKRGRGEYNNRIKEVVEKARKGETLTSNEALSLQPVKGFHYQREYDSYNNKMTSTQIKYSTIPLIPSMVKGTELEKLMNHMNNNAIDEVFFESAHKVGAKMIYQIDNPDGTINEQILKNSKPNTYLNRDYKIQLDTPEHLVDAENILAVQISKLIITNLANKIVYKIGGDKDLSSEELINHYFKVWTENIEESALNLLKELQIEVDDNGEYVVVDEKIKKVLEKEVERRGLSDNYNYAIELDEQGKFKLPLFINNMSTKWEAILTSLFTNHVTRQKLGGGSAVLASRLFLDKSTTQSDSNITGIKWSKEKENDKTLRSFSSEDGKFKTVEVLLGGWSKHLYKNGQLIDIDEVPDEVKTMIGYRIPTTSKSYMTVFKVVGLLPEEAKGIIVTPDDMITQMGQDFDIDKWFLINKDFFRTKKDKFVVPRYGGKEEFNALQDDVKELDSLIKFSSSIEPLNKGVEKLMDDIFTGQESYEDLRAELEEKRKLLKQFGKYNENGSFEYNPKSESKAARNNEMFEIYKSILTNPTHFKEVLTPSGYPNITEVSDEIDRIFGTDDKNIEPLTEAGQRAFRRRNIAGKNLLGISANFNGFMAVAQVTGMELNHNIAYKQKVDLSKYNLQELKDRYGDNLHLIDDGKYAIITLNKLGYAPDSSYLNIDNELIMEVASEGVVAAADNAKDPRLEKLNLSTYTYPAYHAGVSVGITPKFMGFFMRQPILKMLNDYYFENKSILSDETGKQIETIKRVYQTLLLKELIRKDPQYQSKAIKSIDDKIAGLTSQKTNKSEKEIKDINEKIKKLQNRKDKVTNTFTDYSKKAKSREKDNIGITTDTRYLIYMGREVTEDVLGYDPNELDVFSTEELEEQLKLRASNSMSSEERVKYLTTQLQILEYFNRWKKAGEGISDMAKIAKTDGLGAGPTMDITSDLIRTIESLEDNERVLIQGKPAITKLYPSHFGLEGKSVYPPLEAYLEHSNKLSRDVLSKLFITQTLPYRNVVYTIAGKIKGTERRTLDEDEVKQINKFLNVSLMRGFKDFSGLNSSQVLGVSKEPIEIGKEIDFSDFVNLSTAEKVAYMKAIYKDKLSLEPQHILNFLTPVLDNETIKAKGYHNINFLFYKNEFTDDNLADSISTMYEIGNNFERELAESLIHYSFVSSGLTYGLKSYSKVIPSEVLYKIGIGEYLRDRQTELENNISGFDAETVDLFFRNNWGNSSFVPVVKTRWEYIKDASGNKYIRKDENNNRFTKNRTPIWDASKTILRIGKRQISNMQNSKVEIAPYVSIWTKDGLKLYKKYTEIYFDELGKEREADTFNGDYYYYQVNKLGKDGIFEFEKTSIFADNNVEKTEGELVVEIQNIINNIKKQNNSPKTENTSKEKKEEIINKCNIPGK
jgi:hypothetical protein